MAHYCLPHELSDRVIDFLHDDPVALSACSLTCRSWLPAARYHRWSHTCILGWKIQPFGALLGTSLDLGTFVACLDLGSSTVPVIRAFRATDVNLLLTKLPRLEQLYLRYWDIDDEAANVLATNGVFRALVGLALVSCRISSFDAAALLLATPRLTWLSLEDAVVTECTSPWEPPPSQPTPRMLSLTGSCLSSNTAFLTWISRAGSIESFRTCIRSDAEAVAVAGVLMSLGPSLAEFNLIVDADANLEAVFRESNFTLGCLSRLRKCHLAFRLREMCVQGNRSLPYITALPGHLASPDLQQITLQVNADSMEDLRALDSECGVRDAHLVQFDDLRALDWDSLESSLKMGKLPSTRRIILQGRGESLALATYISNQYPAIADVLHLPGI